LAAWIDSAAHIGAVFFVQKQAVENRLQKINHILGRVQVLYSIACSKLVSSYLPLAGAIVRGELILAPTY
jgi:hypothetical protein